MTTKSPLTPFFRVRKTKLAAAIAGSILATSIAPSAFAQELEEVMVTATKRSESVQDVPLAITAFSGNFTKDVNMDDVKDLVSFTPGVTGNSQDSFIDAISIRGIRTQDFGIGGDPSAAFFKNDLYEGRNGSAVTSLFDMERSAILRGPQGFLFGRNSIGGAFSVHTAKAQIGGEDGYMDIDLAENNRRAIEGAINIPVSDNFAMRVAGYYSHEDGVIPNKYDGSSPSQDTDNPVVDSQFYNYDGDDLIEHEKTAFRWSTTFEQDQLSVQTFVEYETRNQSGSIYRAIEEGDTWDALVAAIPELQTLNGDKDSEVDSDLGSGDSDDADIMTIGIKLEYDFDFATLTSNTGYKDHDYFYTEDYDGTPLYLGNYTQDQEGDYFQQELRLTSNNEGALSWYAGASYYKEDIETTFTQTSSEDHLCQYYGAAYYPGAGSGPNGTFTGCVDLYAYYGYDFEPKTGILTEPGTIKGEYTGWSTYVNLGYEISDTLEAEIGLRHTNDKKVFALHAPEPDSDLGSYWNYGLTTTDFIEDSASWSDTQTRALVRWRPTDEAMYFFSYTEGFKSGGFASFNLSDQNGDPVGFGEGSNDQGITPQDGYGGKIFDPERVDSYEIGYKDTWFDGTADVSFTAFFYEYEDLQIVANLPSVPGPATVENLGKAESYGIEGTITAPINDNFSVFVSLSWLDSKVTGLEFICDDEANFVPMFDDNGNQVDDANLACEDNSIFWAPEFSYAVVLNSHHPIEGGELKGSLELFGESERGGGWGQNDFSMIDAQTEMAFRYGYFAESGWNVGMYIENLTDEDGWDGQNNNGGILPAHFFGPKRPRTFGLNLGYEWE